MSSAGFIIFDRSLDGEIKFLILDTYPIVSKNRNFDIPKGMLDEGEDNLSGALRELFEEVNLTQEDIIPFLDKDNNIVKISPDLSPKLCLYLAKIKKKSIENIKIKKNPETYNFEHSDIKFDNTNNCENLCLYYLKGIFKKSEDIIKNYEY